MQCIGARAEEPEARIVLSLSRQLPLERWLVLGPRAAAFLELRLEEMVVLAIERGKKAKVLAAVLQTASGAPAARSRVS